MSYIAPLALMLTACFAVQTLALHFSGGRTLKSESNFFSSLGRIQAGAQGKPEAMVVGSSITGRLPDRAQGFEGWANMGCDGGTAVDVLRAMDEGILPTAPLLVMEANTLHRAMEQEQTEIGQAMRGPWFEAGLKVPQLSAYARPAAFLYSPLLARKIGDFGESGESGDLEVSSKPHEVTAMRTGELSPKEEKLVADMERILGRLKARGSEAVMVWLPPARRSAGSPPAWILELCRRAEIPYWDLGQEAPEDLIRLTDGIHMSGPSAARTMRSLTEVLGKGEAR